jgi:hypothetical protein
VTADFDFGQAGEIDSIDLMMPFEIPIRSLYIEYYFTGDTDIDFSMERATGYIGATYWDDFQGNVNLADPLVCFPNAASCPTTFNQINVRLRPYSMGPGQLIVTGIHIGL